MDEQTTERDIAPPRYDRMKVREVEELRAQAAQLRSTQAELDRAREELRQHKEVPTPETYST